MTFKEVIRYLRSLPPFIPRKTVDGRPLFDLVAVRELAVRLGDPQNKLKCVHIAGTNGKGSVAEFLSEILVKSGYRVGTFTSPYLTDIREQTKINGEIISEDDFSDILSRVIKESEIQIKDGFPAPSEFEMDVVASFLYFLKGGCDVCVIETGLGGKYDASNIIENPLLCIFTEISMDHMTVLGDTLSKIAEVKSGIIKNCSLCVSSHQEENVLKVLQSKVRETGSELRIADGPTDVSADPDGTCFKCVFDGKAERFKTNVTGIYQAENASLAVTASQILKSKGFCKISVESVKSGILSVKRPGRFEILSRNPMVIADGAHNRSGVEALADSLKEIFPERYSDGKGFVFVIGLLEDKEYDEMLKPVLPHVFKAYTVTPGNVRAMSALKLDSILKKSGVRSEAAQSVKRAVKKAMDFGAEYDLPVVIFGSLYYMGEVREIFH